MSFWELFIVGIIALIVLGPERLPKAARTVGLWIGKAKQGFNSIKDEIDRELKVKELQAQIEEQKKQFEKNTNLSEFQEVNSGLNKIVADSSEKIDISDSSNQKSQSPSNQPSADEATSNDKPN